MFGGAAGNSGGFSFGQNKPAAGGSGFSFGNNNNNANNNNNNVTNNASSSGFGFGANNNTAPKPSGGFGFGAGTGTGTGLNNNTTAAGNTGTGFSFGASNNNTNPTNPTTSFGFGSNNNAGSTGGGLFGAKSASMAPSAGISGTNTGGLFGSKPAGTTTGTGFSFGNTNAAATGNNTNTGGLFGSKPTGTGTQPLTGGLFGNNNASSQFSFGSKPAGATGGLFNSNNNNNNTAGGTGLFGGSNTSTGLFGQQNNQLQLQQQQQQQQQQQLQLTSMTKVSDLPPAFQEELKQLDDYIQTQVNIAEYLKNQESTHEELITSVPRDIRFLEKKQSLTSQALKTDLKFVESFKSDTLEKLNDWIEKLIKVYLQLTNPMSGSNNDQGQSQNTSKIIIGVSGNRTELEQNQNQIPQQSKSIDKLASINVTQVLNSYYIEKIEDFRQKIQHYELLLKEVENCINDLEVTSNSINDKKGGLEMILNALQDEFKLYVELANDYAEIHHDIVKIKGGEDTF